MGSSGLPLLLKDYWPENQGSVRELHDALPGSSKAPEVQNHSLWNSFGPLLCVACWLPDLGQVT